MHRPFALAACLVIWVAAFVNAEMTDRQTWQGLGLHCEEVSSLFVPPTNPNIVYALAINRGIYRSTDGGGGWNPIWVGEHTNNAVSLTISPSNPDHLFVLRYGFVLQLHRSFDGGETWDRMAIPQDGEATGSQSIAVLSDAPDVFLLADGPLWKYDGGTGNWIQSMDLPEDFYYLAVTDPHRPGTVWLGASQGGFYRSDDAGITWNQFPGVHGAREVAFDPLDPDHIIVTGIQGQGGGVLYESTDGGESFVVVNDSVPVFSGFAMDTSVPNTMYASTRGSSAAPGGLYRSTDAGMTWTQLEDRTLDAWPGRDVAVVPGPPHRILASSRRGIAASDDAGASWYPTGNGLPAGFRSFGFEIIPSDPPAALAMLEAGLLVHRGSEWFRSVGDTEAFNGESSPRPGAIASVILQPGTVYAVGGDGINRSTDAGATFELISSERVTMLRTDPHQPLTLFALSVNTVVRSTDGGRTWQPTGAPADLYFSDLLLDPHQPDVLLGLVNSTSGQNLHRSTDAGVTWSDAIEIGGYLQSIEFDRSTPDRVYLVRTDGKLHISEDGGLRWTELEDSDPDDSLPMNRFLAFTHDPITPGVLFGLIDHRYVIWHPDGTMELFEERFFVNSNNDGYSWERLSEAGLPEIENPYGVVLKVDTTGTFLYAWMAERGPFRLKLREPKPRQPTGRRR